jgi:outer membrane murein-binding lipoprotein Lpp
MPLKISSIQSDDDDLQTPTRDLAAKAEALGTEVAVLHQDIRTAGDAVRRAGFRCSTVVASARQASSKNSGAQPPTKIGLKPPQRPVRAVGHLSGAWQHPD